MPLKALGGMLLGKRLSEETLVRIVSEVVSLLLFLFLGEYLWNHILVQLFSGLKPMTSMWQVLGLYLVKVMVK
jgi:hypothetical protein